MQSDLSHIQFNVHPKNVPFYKDLLGFLGWNVIFEGTLPEPGNEPMFGAASKGQISLWFLGQVTGAVNDYDGPGVNHLGIGVESPADVDAAAAHIAEWELPPLFDTPRHRPEFAQSPDHTYYQVMFESPDRILFEVVYVGPKSA
jgi:catechol 2,3-dioxygenase-like lactoylglutathione lyase family enzyme